MTDENGTIRVNRAPVLTLWAAIVAERLGHDEDAAITLGRAVAGASERVKARRIGLEERRDDADRPVLSKNVVRTVRLLGPEIPVVDHEGSDHALDHDKPASPKSARAYVEKASGADLPAVRRAMETLADSLDPAELNRTGFRLYEGFRPKVAPGTKGWGGQGRAGPRAHQGNQFMNQVGRVESVWRYPVKSMAGERLKSAFLGYAGVYGDRVYAFHSSVAHRRFPYLTAREREEMLLCRPAFLHPDRMAAPPNLAEAEATPPGLTPVYGGVEDAALEVALPSGERLAIDDLALASWLGLGGREGQVLSLQHSHHAMTDCRPVSLFSMQTAQQIGTETGLSVDARRFRANVVLDLGEAPGFAEDGLVGRTLRIGERATIAILDRDPRCKMIALDPDTAKLDGAILKCVGQSHEGRAGIYGAMLIEGTVRPGDVVMCLD